VTYQADLGSREGREVIAREAYAAAGGAVQRIARDLGAVLLSRSVYPGADSTERSAEPGAGGTPPAAFRPPDLEFRAF
jgi:hypothetical protein